MNGYKHLALVGTLFAGTVLSAPATASSCYTTASYADAGKTCSDIQIGALNGTPYVSGTAGTHFGPTAISGTVGGTGNTASASAAADFGALHVFAASHYDPGNDFNTANGNAYASFTDQLTAGASGATLDVISTLEGGVSLSASAHSMVHLYDTSNGADLLNISGFLSYNSSSQSIPMTINLIAGHNYLLYSAVEAQADTVSPEGPHGARDAVADLSNTSKLTIDIVSGSYTTVSGHDYSSTVAAGAVPEPATWAMMIAGYGLLGAAARRRRAFPATGEA
jgi:hypothetical protein